MYLSTLALHGFKSFAEPTELRFATGVTAIVGPNGCGKSNIVDAVRWVVGEQRPTALRSELMENVIFNGTTGRKPLGMAEVQLTVENNRGVLPTEYTEVTIGRRLFRDGTSEYLMNGSQCRLKDITGLFMDTGMGADAYSVIELKMIDEILSDNAEDRRRLFEEAAGITRYKKRRRQALRKLDATQADLTRIRDLTDEIQKKVRRLKRQAEKASAYKKHETRLHTLELQLAYAEYDRLAEKRGTLASEHTALKEEVEALAATQQEGEERLAAERRTLAERETALAERRETMQKHRDAVRRLEADQRLQQERLLTARRSRKRLQGEQEKAAERREELMQAEENLHADTAQAEPTLQKAEVTLQEAEAVRDRTRTSVEEKRQVLHEHRRRERQAEEVHTTYRRDLDRHLTRLERIEEEQERTYAQENAEDEEAVALKDRLERADVAQAEAADAAGRARDRLEATRDAHEAQQQALDAAHAHLRQVERRRDAAQAEVQLLDSLVSSYDGFSDAVQFLAEAPDWSEDGALRTVADVLACDEDDRLALDAALGDLAACVVVETEAAARRAIARLHASERGQTTFIILERLALPAQPANGAAQPLRTLVRATLPAYAPLADVLLAGTYLVGSLEEARAYTADSDAGGSARFYTRAGEWVDAHGAVIRGGPRPQGASPVAGRLGRREQLQHARERLETLETDVAEARAAVEEHRAALDMLALDTHREALTQAEQAFAEAERQHERFQYEHDAHTKRREELTDRLAALDGEIREHRAAVEQLTEAAQDAGAELSGRRETREAAEAGFETAEATYREALRAYHVAEVAAVEATGRLETLRRDLSSTRERLAELTTRAETHAEELKALHDIIETVQNRQTTLQDEIEEARVQRNAQEDAVEEADAALAAVKQKIDAAERRLYRLRQEREEALRAENQHAVRLAEITTRFDDLVESIREDFDIDLTAEDAPGLAEDFDEPAARQEVVALRKKLRSIGSVNPLALEEYEEEKERLDFLLEQREDLEGAEDTLLETIREINTTAADRFDETFAAIKDNFSGLFVRLFGEGASATLRLEEENDPLESDVEIIAQPRGKKPSILAQLSSGEKTLTAIALLFAIYLVKPSPFCILDEVDAPLDDANTGRFMNLIREFSEDTQFILVTHNKRTMELADRMYGVTMQEQGVSQLVGVAFEEAVALAEAA